MPRVTTRHVFNQSLNPIKVTQDWRDGRYAFYRADHQPLLALADGFSAPSGAAATVNVGKCAGGFPLSFEYAAIGTQTLLGPLLDIPGGGLEFTQDQTAAEGVQYVFGGSRFGAATAGSTADTKGRHQFTIGGTGPDTSFFLKVVLQIQDVSGAAELAVGWREAEALQAAIDNYTDMAVLNVQAGVINVETILNNAATVTTNSGQTVADAGIVTLEVRVIGARVAYFVNNNPLVGIPEYNFAAGLSVVPMLHFLQAADLTLAWLKSVEVGPFRAITEQGQSQF